MSLTLVAATLLVLGLGAVAFGRVVRGRARPGDLARAYLAGTVAFVALVSIATEYGENGRFRFLVDPIVIGLAVAQVVTWIGAWRSRRTDAAAAEPPRPETGALGAVRAHRARTCRTGSGRRCGTRS